MDELISREAVLKLAKDLTFEGGCKHRCVDATEIKLLPTIKPKTGRWIDREAYDTDRWECSECGRTEPYKENYCPNCGARMESEE